MGRRVLCVSVARVDVVPGTFARLALDKRLCDRLKQTRRHVIISATIKLSFTALEPAHIEETLPYKSFTQDFSQHSEKTTFQTSTIRSGLPCPVFFLQRTRSSNHGAFE